MTFGEKVRTLRKERGISQSELARAIGVSTRTVASYEGGRSYPKVREVYDRLARFFKVDINYLKTEHEELLTAAGAAYGSRGQMQAQEILEQSARLFAGGGLSEEDEQAFIMEMNRLFWDSKERSKKFTPKKYLHDGNLDPK